MELLAHFFGYLNHLLDVRRAAQVYGYWAAIIKQSPQLWTRIDLAKNHSMVTLTLSGSYLLRVYNDRSSPEPSTRTWYAITMHLDPWESAAIHVDEDPNLSALDERATILKSFELSVARGLPKCVDLFGGYASKLLRLDITHIALHNWTGGVLKGLRYLRLGRHSILCAIIARHAQRPRCMF